MSIYSRYMLPDTRSFLGSSEFEGDISHWANSSSEISTCSVRPRTPQDIAFILRKISKTRVPFAVKDSGHTGNPGFSSTPGVQISMANFNQIVIREDAGTVEIGAGLTWTEVYKEIVPKGINVVGGRLTGVGVAGFTLGGGYSWKSNQFGLTVDTLTEIDIVLPDGNVKTVTEKDEDLWFALKGGFNNYGIATKFTLKFHHQPQVWGASISFVGDLAEGAQAAFATFLSQPHDPKAAQLGAFTYTNGTAVFGIVLFYDGPEPPKGLYDELLRLPNSSKNDFKGSFTDWVASLPVPGMPRGFFDGVPMTQYTDSIMKAFNNESIFWGEKMSELDKSIVIVYNLDPFEADMLKHGGPSAYPPSRSQLFLPSSIYFGVTDESLDKKVRDAMRTSARTLHEIGIKEGQKLQDASPYVNYALIGTPLEWMYGQNLPRLRELRQKYDPDDIMRLAGGWKF
ncbi:FAD-binding domain-containing protein [Gloeopeniophorella convolvens]|nr:FAD-binding domain-containing protein [Gloeopeniophorella convolvens]